MTAVNRCEHSTKKIKLHINTHNRNHDGKMLRYLLFLPMPLTFEKDKLCMIFAAYIISTPDMRNYYRKKSIPELKLYAKFLTNT